LMLRNVGAIRIYLPFFNKQKSLFLQKKKPWGGIFFYSKKFWPSMVASIIIPATQEMEIWRIMIQSLA
jgi:hypothetical protein